MISMAYDLAKTSMAAFMEPAFRAGCGFYFPVSIETVS
jgi:hypothetical protein